jgi:carbon-monoxide dehydrogenase medium subunit
MKPAPFEYLAAISTRQAIDVLSSDDDAKIMAGGQSLMPLLALRLARPTVVVDINGLDLAGLAVDASPSDRACGPAVLRMGALVRHRRLELDPLVARAAPVLAEAAALVGHVAIRNRGTIGGSLAHADPAAELPAALVASSGSVLVEGRGGTREVKAGNLFTGFLSTSLAADEVIVEVQVPVAADGWSGGAFCEWSPASADFAEVGVAVAVTVGAASECLSVGAAACGIGTVPLPLTGVLTAAGLLGARDLPDRLLRAVAADVTAACAGAGGDRATLAGLLAARAIVRAHRQARERLRAVTAA